MTNNKNKTLNWNHFIKTFVIIIALICAYFVGAVYDSPKTKRVGMSDDACNSIESQISFLARSGTNYGSDKDKQIKVEQLKELNDIFTKNCKNRKIEVKKPESVKSVEEYKLEPLPEQTCAAIELLLLEKINNQFSEREYAPLKRFEKANLYADLTENGCAENREKFRGFAVREIEIGRALISIYDNQMDAKETLFIYKRLGMTKEALKALNEIRTAIVGGPYGVDPSNLEQLDSIEQELLRQ